MTVRELLARIDSRELSEWMAYFQIEPWGTVVEDHRAGVLAAVVANSHRNPKKRPQPYRATDFFPRRDITPQEQIEQDGAKWREFFSPFLKKK